MEKLLLILTICFLASYSAEPKEAPNTQMQIDSQYMFKPDGQYSVGFHDFFWVNGNLSSEDKQYHCKGNSDSFYHVINCRTCCCYWKRC